MLLEPRGQQPDDAWMPAVAGGDDDGGPVAASEFGIGFRTRLRQHLQFHLLPLLVETAERFGNACGLDRIVGGEQPAAESGIADAPAGIDARPDQIGEMKSVNRLADARDPRKGGQPLILLLARHLQPLDHESAVDAGKRHHIANRRQRDDVEQRKQIKWRGVRQPLAQHLRRLHQA